MPRTHYGCAPDLIKLIAGSMRQSAVVSTLLETSYTPVSCIDSTIADMAVSDVAVDRHSPAAHERRVT